jgi:hypothetical protein
MDYVRSIETPPGGIMTDQAGAITGEVTVRVRGQRDTRVYVDVAYAGSDEFYTVTGSPLAAHAHLAQEIVDHLASDPGQDGNGNARSRDLARFV